MTNEEAIKILRDTPIDIRSTREDDIHTLYATAQNMAIEALSAAEPKTGEWIEAEVLPEVYDIEGVKTWGSKMQCDQCGFSFTAVEGHISQYNYCPMRGARMNGGEEE